MKKKIVICIVLYKKEINNISLKKIPSETNFEVRICVFDNSPEYNNGSLIPQDIEYFPQNQNQGIAFPYNIALDIANLWKAHYLLLLDQDTHIGNNFFDLMDSFSNEDYDVMLPQIFHEKICISPKRHKLFTKKPLLPEIYNFTKIKDRILFINSGSVISVAFLNSIGGFNPIFWLDMQDYWLSLMVYKKQANVKVLNYSISHNLSVMNKEYISIDRYKNQHYYTSVFNFKYESKIRTLIYLFFLVLRYFKRFKYLKKNNFLIEYWKVIFKSQIYDKHLHSNI